jgi:hypothetical protein
MMNEAITWWRGKFGIIAPIGYELRDHWEARWSRFHSLPESKRYPDTPAEYVEIQKRARAIGNVLFKPGETVYAFHSTYMFEDAPPTEVPAALTELLSASRAKFHVENGDASCYTRAFAFAWPHARFDALIKLVADEDINMLTFISPATRNAMCPYDGGFDLFTHAPTPEQMREHFSEWLSERPDYL